MLLVSPISTWILLWSMPKSSAAMLAVEAREPPMSGWPGHDHDRAVLVDAHLKRSIRRRR